MPRDFGSVSFGPTQRPVDMCAGFKLTCAVLDSGGVTCFGDRSDVWMKPSLQLQGQGEGDPGNNAMGQ